MGDRTDRAAIDPRTLAVIPASSGVVATLNPRVTPAGQWAHFDVHVRRTRHGPLEPIGPVADIDAAQRAVETELGERLAWGEQIVELELRGRRLRYAAFVARRMPPPNVPSPPAEPQD